MIIKDKNLQYIHTLKHYFSNPEIFRCYLKNKNRKIWKKKKIIVILNKFIFIKINLEVQNLKDIYLKYKPNKLFNRIIHFFGRL